MRYILPQNFFDRPTITVAKELLGKFLVRKIGRRVRRGMITEVEAYIGPHDKASHASRGRTKRTEIMFGKSGHWYICMVYGMHYCLNVVTEQEGYPAAILIRSVEGVLGPGRVCGYFKIDMRLNRKIAAKKTGLWIEDGCIKINPRTIRRSPRIGIAYAEEWQKKLWRFYIS